jgi:drug/metabolite transporter (DMT)-like permease
MASTTNESSTTTKLMAYLALITAAAIYGGWAIIGKEAMSRGAFPFIFAFYRASGGTFLLSLPLIFVPGLTPENKGLMQGLGIFNMGADLPRILLLGSLMAGNVAGMIGALARLPAMTCSVLQPMIPIITAVVSYFYFNEEMGFLKALSIVCSTTGAVCVVIFGKPAANTGEHNPIEHTIGVAFITMNVFCTAMYFVCQKDIVRRYSPIFLTFVSYLIATCILLPTAILALHSQGRGGKEEWLMFRDHTIWFCVAYGIGFTTAVNYSIMAWANKITTPTTVTTSCCLQPLFGAIMAWFFLDTMVSQAQALGGAFIIVGLAIYARSMATTAAAGESVKLVSGGSGVGRERASSHNYT